MGDCINSVGIFGFWLTESCGGLPFYVFKAPLFESTHCDLTSTNAIVWYL